MKKVINDSMVVREYDRGDGVMVKVIKSHVVKGSRVWGDTVTAGEVYGRDRGFRKVDAEYHGVVLD